MADRKLTGSSALTELDNADLLMAVDVSDTTDGEAGTNKKITVTNLRAEMQEGVFNGDYDSLTNKPMTVKLSVGATAPVSPSENDLWVDTSTE